MTPRPDASKLGKLTKQKGANKLEAAYAEWWAQYGDSVGPERRITLRARHRDGKQLKQVSRGR